MAYVPTIDAANARLSRLASPRVRFLNVNSWLAGSNGRLHPGMTIDRLHPSPKGYQVWADGLRPILRSILGPPAKRDHAPPPTGDPSAAKP